MKTVRENIEALAIAKKAVIDHPMCATLTEEADRIMVEFPFGYAVGGAQMRFVAQGVSKTRAYELLLGTMEKYWRLG